MSYQIFLTRQARKQLSKLPSDLQRRITALIDSLQYEPRPSGSSKLSGLDFYRVRIGDYRVIYHIEDDKLIVEIHRIQHRRDVYRGLG